MWNVRENIGETTSIESAENPQNRIFANVRGNMIAEIAVGNLI